MDAKRRETLIAEELERSKKVLAHYAKEKAAGRRYMEPAVLESFVADCFDAHAPLIERWDGWRWHTSVEVVAPLTQKQVEGAWAEAVAAAKAAGTRGAETAHPRPRAAHRLWRYRTLEADPGAYEGDDYLESAVAPLSDIPITENTPACPPGVCTECDALRAAGHPALEAIVAKWYDEWAKNAPQYGTKVRPKQTVSKAVRGALSRKEARVSEAGLAVWDRFLERLGQLWSAQRMWRLTLSCAPSSFLKLGHYGENSCYACWAGQGYDKLVIATVPSSVVLLMYQGDEGEPDIIPDDGKPIKGAVSGRAWGWIFDEPAVQGVAFQNVYNVYWEQAESPLLGAVANYFGREDAAGLKLTPSKQNWCAGYGTYSNNDARAIVVKGTLPDMHRAFGTQLAARSDYGRYKTAASQKWTVMPSMTDERLACSQCGSGVAVLAQRGQHLAQCQNCQRPICNRCGQVEPHGRIYCQCTGGVRR